MILPRAKLDDGVRIPSPPPTRLSLLVAPLVGLFRYALKPIIPFAWFDLPISILDVVAAVRLCLLLRILRGRPPVVPKVFFEVQSLGKIITTTLLVVYGGEAVAAPLLGVPPSFMLSGTLPVLYATIQAIVEYLPSVPKSLASIELLLSIVDGFTRAHLFCSFIPPIVMTYSSSAISTSPWTLLLSSYVIANGGFFLANTFTFLRLTPLTLYIPPDPQAHRWTTLDLWCAPLVTGFYALLTHAQPFWANAHAGLVGLRSTVLEVFVTVLSSAVGRALPTLAARVRVDGKPTVEALDDETARAWCAALLTGLFLTRTMHNLGPWWKPLFYIQRKLNRKKIKTL